MIMSGYLDRWIFGFLDRWIDGAPSGRECYMMSMGPPMEENDLVLPFASGVYHEYLDVGC